MRFGIMVALLISISCPAEAFSPKKTAKFLARKSGNVIIQIAKKQSLQNWIRDAAGAALFILPYVTKGHHQQWIY